MSDNLLTRICDDKLVHVAHQQSHISLKDLEHRIADTPPCRGFLYALQQQKEQGQFGLIAEIKKASPSKGLIRPDFDPAALARDYTTAGATCLSVLTDTPYFMGSDDDFRRARAATHIPMLRKDFILTPYQVYETRALGADCMLLIMAALHDEQARTLYDLAKSIGLDVLIEIHDEEEAHRALLLKPDMIGINNRNLKTLDIDLGISCQIAPSLPPDILCVGESGLYHRNDLDRLAGAGMTSFLVGESLMRQPDLIQAVKNLLKDGQIH